MAIKTIDFKQKVMIRRYIVSLLNKKRIYMMKTLRLFFMLLCIFMISSQSFLARSSDNNAGTKNKKHNKDKKHKKDKKSKSKSKKIKKQKAKKHYKKSKKQKNNDDDVAIQFQRSAGGNRVAHRSQPVAHPAAIAGGASVHHQNEIEQENQEALEAYILANQNNNANNTYYTY